MDDEDQKEWDGIPNPLTLLYATLLGAVFHGGAVNVHDFAFELAFDGFRTGWLREPFYTWCLNGFHYGWGAAAGVLHGFFVRLLTERPWRESAVWAFACGLSASVLSFIWDTGLSRALWDLRHAPFEIASVALGCVLGVRLCLRYEDAEAVRGFREILWRFVIWER